MEIIDATREYYMAQKAVGSGFILIGSILALVLVVVLTLKLEGTLAAGLKFGLIGAILFIVIGGISYRFSCEKNIKESIANHQSDQKSYLENEKTRMEKAVKNYKIYQLVFGSIVILSVLIVLFVNKPALAGVSLVMILLFGGVLIVEAFSHKSILNYHTFLTESTQ